MMLDHVDRHFNEPDFDAAKLAQKFGCSLRYVHKLFSSTGRSVGEHVNDRRILASARNLLDPGCRRMTIAEIAFAAGFNDISHFNRLFRRWHGQSPRDFRNRQIVQNLTGALQAKNSVRHRPRRSRPRPLVPP